MKEIARDRNFEKMIVELVQNQNTIIAWHSVNGVVSKVELLAKAFRKDYAEIELVVKSGNGDELQKVVGSSRILNLYTPSASISFSAPIKGISENFRIKITLPESYQFYERRENERVQPSKTMYASFEFQKVVYKKSLFDISVGGFSIIIPRNDRLSLHKGTIFPSMVIEIGGKKIKVKAECVNSFSVDRYKLENLPYGGQKIAFKFLAVAPEDQTYINDLVELHLKDTLPFAVNK